MQQSNQQNPFFDVEDTDINIKQEALRYLRYWPWFLLCLIFCLATAFLYVRYSPKIYQSAAKVKILDEGKGMELPSSAFVFKRSNINLENEIEILSSYSILEQVVVGLHLTSSIYEEGNILTTQMASLPFVYEQTIATDSVTKGYTYKVFTSTEGFEIYNQQSETTIQVPNHDTYVIDHDFPFQIKIENEIQLEKALRKTYILKISPLKNMVLGLKGSLVIEPIGEQSDLIKLSMKGESPERSEQILNAIINVFNNDGINDRQQISKRTLDFIDERFVFLAQELDSIEVNKKDFKQDNNLVHLAADSEISMQQRSQSELDVFKIESQLGVANLIEEALTSSSTNDLLPSNIGIENSNINALIQDYNLAILDKGKLISSGGENNPTVKFLNSKLRDLKANINSSLTAYKQQLKLSEQQLKFRNSRFKGEVSRLPEKEKLLRAIERQQKIKESLYLLLLQKREEASINLAITEPSVKVVEYALSSSSPISPKSRIAYAVGLLSGLLIPFGFFYILFMFDTKLHSKKDIESKVSHIPVVGEIPQSKKDETIFSHPNDRSAFAESFRILSSNVDYILPKSEHGKVILCTSTIKGEGKTFVSLNLSLALSSLNKKVLLIGADLRNPQLHQYIKLDKDSPGLSDYLHNTDFDWKKGILKSFSRQPHHNMLVSGSLPPNPAHLLTNGRLGALLEEAKGLYDYIIVDTAPTILVTDTLLISNLADATLYVTRADFTEKNLLDHSIELTNAKKLINMAYVINGVGSKKAYGYNYGYGYGYGEET